MTKIISYVDLAEIALKELQILRDNGTKITSWAKENNLSYSTLSKFRRDPYSETKFLKFLPKVLLALGYKAEHEYSKHYYSVKEINDKNLKG